MKMMKTIGLTAAIVSSTANAQSFGSIEYNYRDGYNADSGTVVNGYSLNLGTYVFENTSIDLSTKFRENDDTSETNTRLEVGATQYVPVTDWLKLYGRAALGNRFDNTDDFAYWSAEAGGVIPVTNCLSLKVGYRYRDSFEEDTEYQTDTVRVSVTYAVSENSSVFLGYDHFTGDTNVNGVNLGYAFKF